MKETVKVNLNGQLFNLDSDAFKRLSEYLDSIESKFASSPDEVKEILEDIESRIAEILRSKYPNTDTQVVTLIDIEQIIEKLGTAEEMDDTTEDGEESKSYTSSKQTIHHGKKRFYRDKDHAVIGGVCSGLAAYIGIDVVWIRILFIVFTFFNVVLPPLLTFSGLGIVFYIILWIVIPPAVTTAQKLEMHGKAVNVENIKDSVKKEYNKVKTGIGNIPKSKEYKSVESGLSEFFSILGNILLVIFKVIGAILAVSLIIALIGVILSFIVGGFAFAPFGFFDHWHLPHVNWEHLTWTGICLFLIIVIPILAIFAKLVRWLFNLPKSNSVFAGIGATVWVIALIVFIVLAVNNSNRGIFRKTYSQKYTLNTQENKTLFIDIEKLDYNHDYEYYRIFGYHFVYDDDDNEFMRHPKLEIVYSSGDEIVLEIQRNYVSFIEKSTGSNNFSVIDYDWSLEGNLLLLDEYFICEEEKSWRLPVVKILLHVPEGRKLSYSEKTDQILDDSGPEFSGDSESYSDKVLEMTRSGLE